MLTGVEQLGGPGIERGLGHGNILVADSSGQPTPGTCMESEITPDLRFRRTAVSCSDMM